MKRLTDQQLKERLLEIAEMETHSDYKAVHARRRELVADVGSACALMDRASALPKPYGGARSSPPVPHWILVHKDWEIADADPD